MKKLNLKLILSILAFVCLSAGIFATQATEQISGKDIIVSQNQDVEDDLMIAGRSVQVLAEIRKDVVAAGQDVTITGGVNGYLIAAGRNVTASGPIGNDLFTAGANIDLNAPIADNAVIAGSIVNLRSGAVVQRDAMIAGGTIDIRGKIMRHLKVAAGEVKLASEVGGSVDARAGKLILLPGTVVRGNLTVRSPQPPEISPQAQVLGRIEHIPTTEERKGAAWFGQLVFSFLALTVLGLAVVSLSSGWTNRVVMSFTDKPGRSLLSGLVGLILIPLITVLLLITVIGIPLAFIALAFYLIALLLSGVFASWLVGGWMLKRFGRPDAPPWVRMVVGAMAVSFCASLPWIGGLVWLAILVSGLGALVVERREFMQSRSSIPI